MQQRTPCPAHHTFDTRESGLVPAFFDCKALTAVRRRADGGTGRRRRTTRAQRKGTATARRVVASRRGRGGGDRDGRDRGRRRRRRRSGVHRHARRRGVRRARVRAGVDQRDHGRARHRSPGAYSLEVSSPGIDRPLRTLAALRAASPAQTAVVKTSRPLDGRTSSRARSFRQKETRSCSTWTASTWPSRSTASSAPTSRARSISARKRASEERKRDVATSELIEALQALAHERKIDEFISSTASRRRLRKAISTSSTSSGTPA